MFLVHATAFASSRTLVLAAILPVLGEVVQKTTVGNENNLLLGSSLEPTARSTRALLQCPVRRRVATFLFGNISINYVRLEVIEIVTHLVIPSLVQQLQVNGLSGKLLSQSLGLTTSIAWHIGGLLGVRQGNQLHVRVGLEDGPEALKGCIDSSAKRRCSDQVDLGVVGEGILQLGTLLMAEICEEGVGDDVVGGAKVVDALDESMVRSCT